MNPELQQVLFELLLALRKTIFDNTLKNQPVPAVVDAVEALDRFVKASGLETHAAYKYAMQMLKSFRTAELQHHFNDLVTEMPLPPEQRAQLILQRDGRRGTFIA